MMNRLNELVNSGKATAFFPRHYMLKLLKVSDNHSYDNEYGEGHYDLQPGEPKLEGTRGEHWSPAWKNILKKYLMAADCSAIDPEALPFDVWIGIQTNPDEEIRKKSVSWMIPAELVSDKPFQVDGKTIDPAVDVLCMGGDENAPTLEWGCWPVKKDIFADTYQPLNG